MELRAAFLPAPLHGPVHGVLTRAEVRGGVLDSRVAEARVLLGFESQTRQTGVTRVPVDVGRSRRGVRTRGGGRVERRVAEVVEVVEAVEAGRGHGHAGAHAHAHGGDGAGRGRRRRRRRRGGEHGLGRQRADGVHRVEEREALGRERGRSEPFGRRRPVVVGVARVHVVVGLHQAVKLRAEAVLTQLGLLVALPLPPFGATVLEPNLQQNK